MSRYTDYSECNPHLALWQSENQVTAFEKWIENLEIKLGWEFESEKAPDGHVGAVDYASDLFDKGLTVKQAFDHIQREIADGV